MDWRDIPSLSALRAFEAAARLGSYSGAARELNVTHAAIAQHVRALQLHLGQPLMERQGRGVVPVGVGRQLARDLAAGFGEIAAGVRTAMAGRDLGPILLTTTPIFAENWLVPRIANFWAAHPGIAVSISADTAVMDLRRESYHLAIRYGAGDWSGLGAERLTEARPVIVGTPAIAARLPAGIDAASDAGRRALARMAWLLDASYGGSAAWLTAQGLDLDDLDAREMSSTALVLAACRAGAGLAVVPHAIVKDDLAAGRLREIASSQRFSAAYYVVRPSGPISDNLRVFLRWLKSVA